MLLTTWADHVATDAPIAVFNCGLARQTDNGSFRSAVGALSFVSIVSKKLVVLRERESKTERVRRGEGGYGTYHSASSQPYHLYSRC